jgi:hypothetical protein
MLLGPILEIGGQDADRGPSPPLRSRIACTRGARDADLDRPPAAKADLQALPPVTRTSIRVGVGRTTR